MEKAISFQRSQVIVMLRATMSTLVVLSTGSRWAVVIDPQLDLVGVAEDRLGDGAQHVDVEALDLAR